MKAFSVAAAVAAGSVVFLSSGPLKAQVLEDIVVTAERREASLQDVPLAVTAIGMGEIANFQVNEAQDLQRLVPSLNMFNNITQPSNLSPSLRGGLQQDASLVTAESPFGIYVDDIYVGRLNGNNVQLSDIERVEVLRGPQGTLYGRNTAYGAIKFVSRMPGDEAWFDATAGAGNAEQALFRASVGGPLGESFAGSLAGQYYNKDEQWFNAAENRPTGQEESYALRGKLRYTGSDKFDAILSTSYARTKSDSGQLVNGVTPGVPETCADFGNPPSPGNPTGALCEPGQVAQFRTSDLVFPNGEFVVNTADGQLQPSPLRDRPQGLTEQTIVGLTLSYDISDSMTVKSITGYVGIEDYFHTDFNGNTAGGAGFIGAADIESDQFTQEFQLLGNLGDRFNYLVGAFFLREEATQNFGWNFVTPLSQSFIDTEIDSIAFFGEATYNFTDRLSATFGIRWTEDDKKFRFDYERFGGNFFDTVVAPGFFPATTESIVESDFDEPTTFDEVTPRIGIDYSFETSGALDSMLLYAQAARGFKSGGFSAISIASTIAVGVYGPETNWTYEGGLKADWFDNRLRTNLAYFFSDIEDVQQNATTPPPAFEFPVENSGDAEIQGLEFELTWVPVDNLNLFLTGSLLDGKYTRLNEFSAAGQAQNLLGVSPQTPQTPDYSYTIGFDYTIDVGGFVDTVAFGVDYYEIDEYVTAATNDFLNDGWDQLNGFVSVNLGDNWELRAVGKNLANETIVTSGSRGLGGFVFLKPREYLFTVTYRTQ